ncbi:transmembrane protein 180 isoform X2 [Chelmon rostratus]|uniref:transmembrane protein 180 isoform X2 n=1 Tax=Chelmon rostratus TaxID=109905 RepID=UPI001BE56686|nr:transmembrane protein 180 isoform X2 [Chelmon rostratus]
MSVEEKPAPGVHNARMSIGRRLINCGLNPAALAYAMTTLGSGMINNIFSFYYVKLFINKYKISEGAFHQSQVVYMVWNAVNDPLFGYLQDNSRVPCCSQRRLSILYGAPLYSLTFLIAWFPWRSYAPGDWLSGLHLTVALCAFDGMLTFVLLAQCALFAEISSHHQSRLRLVKYSQVASLVGSSSVLFCGVLSKNMEDFAAFQAFTVFIAILSCGSMLYTGYHSESRFDNKGSESDALCSDQAHQSSFSFSMLRALMWQILTNRDFQHFVLMNFFQVFMLAFLNNFTMIFAEHLIPPDVLPSLAKSIMYGAGFICPQLLVLSCQSLLRDLGYYRIILFTFYLVAGMAAVMLALGPQHYYILAFFLTVNISPLSSMVFGTNALFTKPAQSLAPMIVLNILNQFGYEQLKDTGRGSDPSALESLHSVMFYLVCLVPMCIAALQALTWRRFSIRSSHTVDTKYIDS